MCYRPANSHKNMINLSQKVNVYNKQKKENQIIVPFGFCDSKEKKA